MSQQLWLLKLGDSDPQLSFEEAYKSAFDGPDCTSQIASYKRAVKIIERRRIAALNLRYMKALKHAVAVVKRRRKEFVKQRDAERVRERHRKEALEHQRSLKAQQPRKTITPVVSSSSSSADVGTGFAALLFRVPTSYPYLESPLNIFLPLHFTATAVDLIHEPGHAWYDAYHSIKGQLDDICNPLVCNVEYGRVHLEKSPLLRLPGNEDLTAPRVLAFRMEPRDIHRWHEVECRVQPLLGEAFGREGPPVRYYYGDVVNT
ncbi:hypothetical protein G7Y79_00013g034400 [Physcia stellaris]|nr:hypothetical protein G7Y79_00013g034400 [Physcia stellaris]